MTVARHALSKVVEELLGLETPPRTIASYLFSVSHYERMKRNTMTECRIVLDKYIRDTRLELAQQRRMRRIVEKDLEALIDTRKKLRVRNSLDRWNAALWC